MKNLTLKSARLADGTVVDLKIVQGIITEISSNIKSDGDEVDLAKNLLLPGLVDLHTHLREPGKENSETVLTGSKAAVRGGYTALSAMANTSPVADSAGVVEQVQ